MRIQVAHLSNSNVKKKSFLNNKSMFRNAELSFMFFKSFRDRLNFHRSLEITWMACFLMMYGRHAGLRSVLFLMFLSKAEGQGARAAVPLETMEGSVEQHDQQAKRDQGF